ncbi:archaea-specific SMC-related protein [Haloarchaeobius sp. HRN-SO-5]|uniref:archaea-specific SMC-related protein n=1 Tax=Haloarchaeobius sp. HRN-SO-5 TaxID=3446118 RepID=UPI003EB95181
MTSAQTVGDTLQIDVENIGGIDETTVDLTRGISVLKGRNATNRTSFLQSLMAAMGSDRFSLKGDADHGSVRLTLGETVVEREFDRRNGVVQSHGEGYLDDPELADLFAFLLEENEARRAVARGDDLREIITRPIDTDEINAEITMLEAEKRQVDEKIETVDERERDLVGLEQRRTRLEEEIADRRERLADLEDEISNTDADIEESRGETAEMEEQLDELKSLRSDLDDVRFQIETTRETIDSLENEREEKQAARSDLSVDPDVDVAELRGDLDDLRERKRRLDAQVRELQSIVDFNQDMLSGTDSEIAEVLRDDGTSERNDGTVTDKLLEDQETVVCWTCGSEVDRGEVADTLDRLKSFRKDKMSERQSVKRDIEETKEQVSEYEQTRGELDDINARLSEIDVEIERKRDRIEDLEDRREELRESVTELEAEVEQKETTDYSELLSLHKDANEAEFELEQKEDELETVESEIAEIESLLDERSEYEERREQITEQLEELRNRIDRLEQEAVEAFNTHMEQVLDILEYENIERIWIERTEQRVREGRQKVDRQRFDLHIIRTTDDGQTYEDTVDHLSESEREVTGLVFALAGYLVHDVYESVPVMLMDSLEAIDSERISRLLDYLGGHADFLVVALLPEDANAIETDHEVVSEI